MKKLKGKYFIIRAKEDIKSLIMKELKMARQDNRDNSDLIILKALQSLNLSKR